MYMHSSGIRRTCRLLHTHMYITSNTTDRGNIHRAYRAFTSGRTIVSLIGRLDIHPWRPGDDRSLRRRRRWQLRGGNRIRSQCRCRHRRVRTGICSDVGRLLKRTLCSRGPTCAPWWRRAAGVGILQQSTRSAVVSNTECRQLMSAAPFFWLQSTSSSPDRCIRLLNTR